MEKNTLGLIAKEKENNFKGSKECSPEKYRNSLFFSLPLVLKQDLSKD